jgi:outer membrane protein assembly factor BamB
MSIDPATGHIDFKFPFRSRTYESANASSPVVFDNKVFITSSYRTGSALVEIRSDFTHRVVWTNKDLGLHFNTPIYKNGFLYGFDGRNPGDASLVCVDATDGEITWRTVPEWREPFQQNGREEMRLMSTYRGSLLAVDGQFLCLGEFGHILWLDLTPQGYKEVSRAWVIGARESWALPVLSRGLLYVVQNTRDVFNGTNPRLLCYDLRA